MFQKKALGRGLAFRQKIDIKKIENVRKAGDRG